MHLSILKFRQLHLAHEKEKLFSLREGGEERQKKCIKCVGMVAFYRRDISNEGLKSEVTNSNAPRGQRGHQDDGREAGGNCSK